MLSGFAARQKLLDRAGLRTAGARVTQQSKSARRLSSTYRGAASAIGDRRSRTPQVRPFTAPGKLGLSTDESANFGLVANRAAPCPTIMSQGRRTKRLCLCDYRAIPTLSDGAFDRFLAKTSPATLVVVLVTATSATATQRASPVEAVLNAYRASVSGKRLCPCEFRAQ